MLKFPSRLYTDIRFEKIYETNITYTQGKLEEFNIRQNKTAFIRVFDGDKWYYSSLSVPTDENITREIMTLSELATPCDDIEQHPIVKKLQVNTGQCFKFQEDDITVVPVEAKTGLLEKHFSILEECEFLTSSKAYYVDRKVEKEFYSSKGAALTFDQQSVGFMVDVNFSDGTNNLFERFQIGGERFHDVENREQELVSYLRKCQDWLEKAQPVEAGVYTVIFSPLVAGVFAHEIFGHNSEADLMLGSETAKEDWCIGKKIASRDLSIVDDGNIPGNGYVPFDDEGTRAARTYLIHDGILRGRLHSAATSAAFSEELTGNARALNFEFEPIVRMTTTYILPGKKSKDELFLETREGIYVDSVTAGSGLSTFSLEPSLAYYIKDGKISHPVKVSLITGKVAEALQSVDGVSDQEEILTLIGAGCGKAEQYPLPIGFGGPFVRVQNLTVQ